MMEKDHISLVERERQRLNAAKLDPRRNEPGFRYGTRHFLIVAPVENTRKTKRGSDS